MSVYTTIPIKLASLIMSFGFMIGITDSRSSRMTSFFLPFPPLFDSIFPERDLGLDDDMRCLFVCMLQVTSYNRRNLPELMNSEDDGSDGIFYLG